MVLVVRSNDIESVGNEALRSDQGRSVGTARLTHRSYIAAKIRILAALLAVVPAIASAQSLADVAKAEEARRKTVSKAAKVYTNSDLRADFTVPTPSTPAPAAAATAEPGTPATTDATAGAPVAGASKPAEGADSPQGEAFWKARMNMAKDSLNRSRMFLEALQSRINALTTQVINRDDPYQQATLEQERQKNLSELARVQRDIADQTKAITDIENEARRAGVPPGWLR
jgi:hypothetical protein